MATTHKDLKWDVCTPDSSKSSAPQKSSAPLNESSSTNSASNQQPKMAEPAEEPVIIKKEQDDSCYAKVKLESVEILPGPSGNFDFDLSCKARAKVSILRDDANKKITFKLVGRFKESTTTTEDTINTYDGFLDKDGIADVTIKLNKGDKYIDVAEKDKNLKCDFVVVVSNSGTSSTIESKPITLPKAGVGVLQKNNYDETGAEGNQKPKEGEHYKPGNLVLKLQKDLQKVCCYFGETLTGYYGEVTMNSVKSFQVYAQEKCRMQRKLNKIEETSNVLQKEPDGVFDDVTAKELQIWLDKGYIVPHPSIREGEIDDEGVKNGKGQRGSDEYHDKNVVINMQKDLSTVSAYSGKVDGHTGPKTIAAANEFIDAAKKGTFIIDGKETTLEEKLPANARKGTISPEVQAYAKIVVGKGGKMPAKKAASVLSGSVGADGKTKADNKPEDVKKIKQKLKDLGYPISKVDEICDADTIKAIKYFQVENGHFKKGPIKVDGRIDSGGSTESKLFGSEAKKYKERKHTGVKKYESSIETRKNDALKGTDKFLKETWERIDKVWEKISPYLPENTKLASGYRNKDKQREQLFKKYRDNQDKIEAMFGKKEWHANDKKIDDNLKDSERDALDVVLHQQICDAVSHYEVALPGKSMHEKGRAIDTQVSDPQERIKSLLWYSFHFENELVKNIYYEKNECIHFEFDN